jgi:deoxyadenosine/deoxycytidine kinase
MKHIAIAGNIGAGKTTLASLLAKHFGWEVSFESVEDNPYLADFYEDMDRWAFHLQIYFLNHRFNQVLKVQRANKPVVQDRTIYEDAYVFAKNLFEDGKMNIRDYHNYLNVFKSMAEFVTPPDLLIYLKADLPKLTSQISKRGRDFEANIPETYLKSLNEHYDEWIRQYDLGRLLVIDINDKDFLNNPDDWSSIVESIKKKLN